MRIAKLSLLAYGAFRGLELDLGRPGVHVVFGRNEAGKSTTLRAITGLLYGIDHRTRDAHLHKPADLRIGGTLVSESGERLRIVRRKGNANTLLDERGQPVDEAIVRRLLRGVSEETFRHAFGLDHETLRRGAQGLLEGKGDLGESLFDASVGGGGDVQRLLGELNADAEALWKPRSTTLPLADALRAFADAQRLLKERQSLPEAYVAQVRALEEARTERGRKAEARVELLRRRAELDRARKRAPLERRRAALVSERASLAAFAAKGALVAELDARVGEHERAVATRRDLAVELGRAEARAAEAARRAGVDASDGSGRPAADPPAWARVDARKEARLQRLVADRVAIEERAAVTRDEIARAESEISRMRAEASAPPEGWPDTGELAAALERARAVGDLEARLAADAARVEHRRRELEAKVAALGVAKLGLDAFVALDLPAVDALEALGRRADHLDRAIGRLEERRADVEVEAATLDRQLAEHTGSFAPPDAAALGDARARRDAAWTRTREASDAAERAALDVAFERAMRDVDAIADRMLAEADRVTTLARLRARRTVVTGQATQLEAELAVQRRARSALDEELARLFVNVRVAPSTVAAALVWLERHAQIAEAHRACVVAESEVAAGEELLARTKADLAAALADRASHDGATQEARGARLADLVRAATRRLAGLEERRRSAEEADRAAAKLEATVRHRSAALARDEAALSDVKAKLAELVTVLGLDADASADEVTRALDAVRELASAIGARARIDAQLRAIDAAIGAFERQVTDAARDLAPDLADVSAAGAARVARAIVDRSLRAEAIDRELATIDADLAELGSETLPREVCDAAADADATQRMLEELDAAIERADDELRRDDQKIGGIESGLATMRGDSHAADAAAAAQEALARVRAYAERWSRAKLAAVILGREIERYREENQGPLLGRASTLFARLTLGAFTGMKAGFDDRDRPALRMVRAGGAELDVSALSEGTRDQLYLSLRLASLLRYAEVAEPMPLVLDDVLVHFDDERSAAALAVLGEIAQRTQILFFTHHARLIELARSSIPREELVVHELTAASATALVVQPTAP